MEKTTYTGDWKNDAHAVNGTKGSHYDLARYLEIKGFEVIGDSGDNERSIVCRPGDEDSDEREIGEIVGDDEAVVRITVDLS